MSDSTEPRLPPSQAGGPPESSYPSSYGGGGGGGYYDSGDRGGGRGGYKGSKGGKGHVTTMDRSDAAEAVTRTVHILGIDGTIMEAAFAGFLDRCGPVARAKICGDPRGRTLYGFIEFSNRQGAENLVNLSGSSVGNGCITTSFAKSAIRSVSGPEGTFNPHATATLMESTAYYPTKDDDFIGKSARGKGSKGGDVYGGKGSVVAAAGGSFGKGGYGALEMHGHPAGAPHGKGGMGGMDPYFDNSPEARQMRYQAQVMEAYRLAGYAEDWGAAGGAGGGGGGHRSSRRGRDSSDDSYQRRKEKKRMKKEKKEKRRRRSSD